MNYINDLELSAWIAEELGESYSRLCLRQEPQYLRLFDALILNVGLKGKDSEHLGFVIKNKDSKKHYYLDYYYQKSLGIRKSNAKFKVSEELLETFDKNLINKYSRRIGTDGRKFTKDQAEIFICCSAAAYSRPLKLHLAEFFKDCHDEGLNIICLEEFKNTINKLIKDELSPKNSQANSSLVLHLDFPQKIEGNNNYYGNQFVDVIGRDVELKRLSEFLDCKQHYAWFQIAGVAGQGKSRLAFEVIKKAKSLDWEAGLLESIEIDRMKDHWWNWQPDKPHLIVIDYVISRIDAIRPLFKILSRRRNEFQYPVRLLLLERQRWDQGIEKIHNQENSGDLISSFNFPENRAEWFLDLTDRYDGNDKDISEAKFDKGVLELENLDADALVDIVNKIAKKFSDIDLNLSDCEIKEQLNHIDKDGRPLYAYFYAQEISQGGDLKGWSNYDLLRSALTREQDKWWKVTFDDNPPYIGDDIPPSRLAVIATMTNGLDCKKAFQDKLIPNYDSKTRRQALALTSGLLNKSVTGSDHQIPSLQPDLLGEWFVITSFEEGLPLDEICEVAWKYAPDQTASFLARVLNDFHSTSFDVEKMLEFLQIEEFSNKLISRISHTLLSSFYHSRRPIPQKIISMIEVAANKGSVQSTTDLGWCYQQGAGVDKSDEKSFHWFLMAAKKGSPKAMPLIGSLYSEGLGVKKSLKKAFEWYQKAANTGSAHGMHNLGHCYDSGLGVEKDPVKAFEYYSKAANLNVGEAMLNLGGCYHRGNGVKKNDQLAFEWYEKALNNGQSDSAFYLGLLFRENHNEEKALEYFQKGAIAGHNEAMYCLAFYYALGLGVEKNDSKAFEWFKKSVDAGNLKALHSLGTCYLLLAGHRRGDR